MQVISNDTEFRQALEQLDPISQRVVAVKFVENVLALGDDRRISRALETAADTQASEEELSSALKQARAAALESHTRCGADGDWREQAGYFVARAAASAFGTAKKSGLAWSAAMSCRMARTCTEIDTETDTSGQESAAQYATLSEFLNH